MLLKEDALVIKVRGKKKKRTLTKKANITQQLPMYNMLLNAK